MLYIDKELDAIFHINQDLWNNVPLQATKSEKAF